MQKCVSNLVCLNSVICPLDIICEDFAADKHTLCISVRRRDRIPVKIKADCEKSNQKPRSEILIEVGGK